MELEHVRIALSGLMIGLVLTVGARDDLAFFDYAISQTRPQTFVMSNGEILPFRYHAPEKVERGKMYPLVLLMHGAGSRGTNNVNQIRHGGTQLFDWARRRGEKFFFIAPQCPDGKQWVDVPWSDTSHRMKREPTPGLAGAFAIVNDVMRREPVDPSRVYVMGISMGGYATWELLQRRPGLFAGALPCCGGGDALGMEAARHPDLGVSRFGRHDCSDVAFARDGGGALGGRREDPLSRISRRRP